MDVHFGSENPIDIHILTEFEMDIHRMTLSGWGMDVYMGIWNGFEMNIPRMPLLGWPEEKFFRSVWKNGIWTHWKSVRKESSKFRELAFKGRILTWFILLTGNRTIGGVVPNSAFFFSPFWRRKFFLIILFQGVRIDFPQFFNAKKIFFVIFCWCALLLRKFQAI